MPVYRRGVAVANGMPAADGKQFDGIVYLTEAAYAALSEKNPAYVYVVIDGTGTGDILEAQLAVALQAKLLGTKNVVAGNLADALTAKLITQQAHIADSAEATAPTTAQFNALLAALEAAGVLASA